MLPGFIQKQFIDVIEWTEEGNDLLAFRYPMEDKEIQNGAQLTVRESQAALFVNEGRIADAFKPGRFQLSTATLPILTNLMNWDKAFQSPFKSDVYFFSTREKIDQRWGTQTPVTIRDKDFGAIRLRAHGVYAYRVEDVKVFHQKLSGTKSLFTTEELEGQLRGVVLTSFATLFGNANVSFLDMAANQKIFSENLQKELDPAFADYGLKLTSFFVQSITLPEELEKHLEKAMSMRMVGDLKQYTQFQAADSLPMAAQNEGGAAAAGASMGAGLAMGQVMAQSLMPGGGGGGAAGEEDPMAAIERLHELLKKGVLTQEEFDAKKAELLRKIN